MRSIIYQRHRTRMSGGPESGCTLPHGEPRRGFSRTRRRRTKEHERFFQLTAEASSTHCTRERVACYSVRQRESTAEEPGNATVLARVFDKNGCCRVCLWPAHVVITARTGWVRYKMRFPMFTVTLCSSSKITSHCYVFHLGVSHRSSKPHTILPKSFNGDAAGPRSGVA